VIVAIFTLEHQIFNVKEAQIYEILSPNLTFWTKSEYLQGKKPIFRRKKDSDKCCTCSDDDSM